MVSYCSDLIPVTGLITGFSTRHITREGLCSALQLTQQPLITMNQTHSANLTWVTEAATAELPDTDAIATTLPGVTLAVKTADCLPILIYHPSGVIAAIHAGRKGTENQILANTLNSLISHTGTNQHFYIYFGPAICENCYQINPETDAHFALIQQNQRQAESRCDLRTVTLLKSGECTACSVDQYYSYRKEKATERIWSVISFTVP